MVFWYFGVGVGRGSGSGGGCGCGCGVAASWKRNPPGATASFGLEFRLAVGGGRWAVGATVSTGPKWLKVLGDG
jgi:hypothetical protein